ncbi:MAG: efflux RND transporter permease subunit [Tumebacillaceae bacterium]
MKIADFSVKRPVTIMMIMIVLIILGTISIPLLPVELMPNLTIPTLNVTTSWSGASPGEVEAQITKKVEAQMATIPGVTEVDSTSRTGASLVTLHLDYGVNLDQTMLNIRDKLDRVKRSLPSDADAPTVNRFDLNSQPVLTLAVFGNIDQVSLRNLADSTVSSAVQRVDGVGSVTVSGGRQRQVLVTVDPAKLQEYGLTINSITSALGSDNTSMDAGQVQKGSSLVPLHLDGEFRSIGDIQKVQVSIGKGGSIALGQLATVVDTFKDVTSSSRKDGLTAVTMSVVKQSDSNTVSVSNNVQKSLAAIQSKLPNGVKVAVMNDQAAFIRNSISTVVDHTLLGGVFSILILLLFLRNVRATIIIGVVIPIAVVSTFSMMYFSNQTINTITLGGLALGLGSLVDFAVVVLESIFRKRSQGLSMEEAAKQGTKEVGTAVLASALAQIAVFAPAAFMNGMAQQIFLPIALTVSFSHIAALFAAITLVPMMASKMLKGHFDPELEDHLPEGKTKNPAVLFQRGMKRVYSGYGRLLEWALEHRKTVVFSTLAIFVASVALIPLVGTELSPATDQGNFSVSVQMPNGSTFDQTNKVATQVEDVVHKISDVDSVFTSIGGGGGGAGGGQSSTSSVTSANIQVALKKNHKASTDQVVEQVRTATTNLNPDAKINVRAQSATIGRGLGGAGGGSDVQVVITGPSLDVLQKLGDMVSRQMMGIDGVRNATNTLDKAAPQINVTIDRDAAARYGVAPKDIMSALRSAYQGSAATTLKTGDSQVDVIVSYPTQTSQDLGKLSQMILTTASGAQVPLTEVAKIAPGSSPASIARQNQQRQATITANIFGVSAGQVSKSIQQLINNIQAPDGYQISMGGSTTDMTQSFQSLGIMLLLSIVLVYMVMASQFESLYGPFVIMFSLPPTFVGALIGLVVTHRTINMNSIIGMIMLVGIVVNNAIVLIDFTNQLRREGHSLKDALLQAGPIRLRPILMTTGTTVLAMLPLVIGFGEGAETQASMATVVAFGLIFSTLVTLVLVPVVYMIMDKRIEKFKQRFFKKKQGETTDPLSL